MLGLGGSGMLWAMAANSRTCCWNQDGNSWNQDGSGWKSEGAWRGQGRIWWDETCNHDIFHITH